jgi:hypothetical protein
VAGVRAPPPDGQARPATALSGEPNRRCRASLHTAASDGGHCVVAWGPAIFGAIAFVRGPVGYLEA